MRFFGLETKLKRIRRLTAWRTSLLTARASGHPSFGFFRQSIKPEVWRLDRMAVVPEQNLIFLPIMKNANSKVMRILAEVRGIKNPFSRSDKTRYRSCPTAKEIPIQELYRILNSKDRLIFAVVRNPYERVYSAWASKFRDRALVPSRPFQKPTPEIDTYLRLRKSIAPSLPEGADARLNFDLFLTYVSAIVDDWVDPHIVPQSRFLSISFAPVDRLIRLESFSEDMIPVLDRLKAPPSVAIRLGEKVNASGAARDEYAMTASQRKIIERLYREDFEAFGYPRR